MKKKQDSDPVSLTDTPADITTATNAEEQISHLSSSKRKRFATKLRTSFGVSYRKISDVGMKQRALKPKQDCLFWSSAKRRKVYKKIVSSLSLRSG